MSELSIKATERAALSENSVTFPTTALDMPLALARVCRSASLKDPLRQDQKAGGPPEDRAGEEDLAGPSEHLDLRAAGDVVRLLGPLLQLREDGLSKAAGS